MLNSAMGITKWEHVKFSYGNSAILITKWNLVISQLLALYCICNYVLYNIPTVAKMVGKINII